MIRRLRVKFICINMAIVTVMMLAILGMLLHFTRNDLEQQSIRVMQSVMEDRAYPSRPGEFPRQAKLPYFYVSVNTMGELSASFGGYYDLTNTEAIQKIITLALNSDDQTGILKDYSLRFQKRTTPFGQTIVFVDMSSELTTMRSLTNTCVIIGVLSFAVFLGLSFLLARWAVKPVETAWNQQRQFVADASHELKTPMTSIKVLSDSLLAQENVPAELYREFMEDIASEIDRENQIITDLLALVKMDKKVQDLNIVSLNINDLTELILKRLRPIARKKDVEVVFESVRPVVAEVDEVKMTLIMTNLVENAIKYNKENGWVHVSLNADHKNCYIEVADSGIGIPAEAQEHIFERFYRVDKSHSREIGGTGLGLAIARSAVVMHRGAIKVFSQPSEGTTFTVRIPLNYVS